MREAGCAIIGQTADLAPADRRLYAIRDVTATVESIPLITASILSKKLAGGLQALVMDVKIGSGAFMPTLRARRRRWPGASSASPHGAGLPTTALLTDMGQCLGHGAGNAVEVARSDRDAQGRDHHPQLEEVVLALCGEALALAGLAADAVAGRAAAASALSSGTAAERFARMARGLGGPADLLERHQIHLPLAPLIRPIHAPRAGHVRAVDARGLGLAVVELGGGRRHAAQPVDHAVGLTEVRAIGDEVGPDRPLAMVHARDEAGLVAAVARVLAAYQIGDEAVVPPMILDRIG